MAQVRLFLDTRRVRKDGTSPLKISVSHRTETALISLDVHLLAEHWDGAQIIKHPQRAMLNHHIMAYKMRADSVIYELSASGEIKRMTVAEVKKRIMGESASGGIGEDDATSFAGYFARLIDKKSNRNTKSSHRQTLKHLKAFDPNLGSLTFDDITPDWVERFELYLEGRGLSVNSRAVYLRNLRTVINDAIDNELTSRYAFRRVKIKTQETRKRSLLADKLRELATYPCEPHQVEYRDMFMLSFYLLGINSIDLFSITKEDIIDGRIVYNRSKTGKLYDIKIEPEARAILDRHKGARALLAGMDRNKDYRNYSDRINEALKRIGEVKRVGRGGRKVYTPILPKISMYWARHSWATIAMELDIPREVISRALGHGAKTVTDIYIDFDRTKVDEANRRVIDYVLYGKR